MRFFRPKASSTSCSSCFDAVVRLAAKSVRRDGSFGPKRLRKNFSSSEYSGLSGSRSLMVLMMAME